MVRLVLYLLAVAAMAAGLSWLADRPGSLVVVWEGYEAETSVFRAVVLVVLFLAALLLSWTLLRQVWRGPLLLNRFFSARRQKRGLDALSSGMIAIGAGDRVMAARYAALARKSLPNEPLTHLLRAQTAQLSGDKTTARRIFEAMLATPDTEQLGLRGLFVEAEREGETEACRQFAERALRLNPKLAWPVDALFGLQCRAGDWAGALSTLAVARRARNISRHDADRRRAVLLTAQAKALEEGGGDRALGLALEAHALAPDLVPAAVIAGRLLASRGNTPRATRVIEKTWARSPHPDLALVYAHARVGDSPRDRLERVRHLAALAPNAVEGPIAAANAAIEARLFDDARRALEPLFAGGRATRGACLLMARVEGEQHGDKGRVREWLARAVNAPRDPAWTADGAVAEDWAPVSPVTGALDAFQWRAPVEAFDKPGGGRAAEKLEELVSLGASREEAEPAIVTATAIVPAARPEELRPEGGTPASKALVPHGEARGPDEAAVVAPASVSPSEAAPPAPPAPIKAEAPARAEERRDPRTAEAAAPGVIALPEANRESLEEAARNGGPAAPRDAPETRDMKPAKPHIFVPPRAPDDPGPDPGDFEEDRFEARFVRPT